MIRKTILGLAASAALVTVALTPTAASAHYYGYNSGHSYGYRTYYKPHNHYNSYNYYTPSYKVYRSYRYGY